MYIDQKAHGTIIFTDHNLPFPKEFSLSIAMFWLPII